MNCYLTCTLGAGLLAGNIYTMMTPRNEIYKIKELLDQEGLDAYEKIEKERLMLYIQGIILGLILAFILFIYTKDKVQNQLCNVCLFVVVALLTGMIYYKVMPKSDYMLNHLKTPEQNKEWLKVYKTMQNRYHTGFFTGAIAYAVICYAFCD